MVSVDYLPNNQYIYLYYSYKYTDIYMYIYIYIYNWNITPFATAAHYIGYCIPPQLPL